MGNKHKQVADHHCKICLALSADVSYPMHNLTSQTYRFWKTFQKKEKNGFKSSE